MTPVRIFVGYDPREAIAYHVCVNSIIRHASRPVSITPLALNLFKSFYDEVHTDGSNSFIYSRFLVPYLCGFQGHAIFLDGDMVLRADITDLLQYAEPGFDVAVVKHDYKTQHPVKYFGNKNEDYPRKNWSSVMVYNCYTSPCHQLTPDFVARKTGSFLHRFEWTTDARIAEIPREWNHLVDEYEHDDNAKLLHYTLAIPAIASYEDCDHCTDWWDEYHATLHVDGG